LQVLLQLPGLRDAHLRFVIDLHHPDLWRVGKLYLPIVLGLLISQVAIGLDRNLASRTGEQSIAWMQFATTIIQFPLGLVSTAISLAILPTLSRQAASTDSADKLDEFMDTLAAGLRMVLILIIPATIALFILSEPVVALLFQRGNFTAYDTAQTVLALRIYLIGLTFAAIDLPLVFAFYARQNTVTPTLVGLVGVGIYMVVALVPALFRPLRMTDLVLANSVQLTGHALIMLWLTNRIASLHGRGLGATVLKATAASLLMGAILWWTLPVVQQLLFANLLTSRLVLVGLMIVVGGGVYLLALFPLKVPELKLLTGLLRRFVPK
jgi:putative peptidoglycan lipid II flippase